MTGGNDIDERLFLDAIQQAYVDKGGVFLVIVDEGRIVGTGAFWRYAEGVCEVKWIALAPECRGRGMGHAMTGN